MKSKGKALLWTALYMALAFIFPVLVVLIFAIVVFLIALTGGITDNSSAMLEYVEIIQDVMTNSGSLMLLNGLSELLMLVCFGLWYYFREHKYTFRPNYRQAFSAKNVLSILGLGLFGQMAVNLIIMLVYLVLPGIFKSYEELAENFELDTLPPAVMLFMVCLLGPLAEEMIFRGMIYGKLRRAFSLWPAAWISGLLFGIFHMNLVQGIYATLFGVILAYIYERTQTIWGCTLLHCVFNASSYLAEEVEGVLGTGLVPEGVAGIGFLLFEIVSVVFIFLLLRRFRVTTKGKISVTDSGAVDKNSDKIDGLS
ncbi:MAG: CPBP family intramembrane metalloprotease [Lachnospiraceae bacterium]|nr:CPBP family intramembrane metalloprotease [Lachnospiraceae bacterium]